MPDEPTPEKEWQGHFPLDCPDDGAVPTNGLFFRLICGDHRDWKSAKELEEWLNHPECKRASLSCFSDVNDATDLRDALPKFASHKIARAILEPRHGKIRPRESDSHVSLWLRAQFLAIVQELFQLIE
jgi:hypothetical protein